LVVSNCDKETLTQSKDTLSQQLTEQVKTDTKNTASKVTVNEITQLSDGTLTLTYECSDVQDQTSAKKALNTAVKQDDVKQTINQASKSTTNAKQQQSKSNHILKLYLLHFIILLATKAQTDAPTTQKQTAAPTTQKQTAAPTTQKQTDAPTTQKQTAAPTTQKQTAAPTTQKQTAAPTTQKQTAAPTTQKQTAAPTTQKQTAAPTTQKQTAAPTTQKQTSKSGTTPKPSPPSTVDCNNDYTVKVEDDNTITGVFVAKSCHATRFQRKPSRCSNVGSKLTSLVGNRFTKLGYKDSVNIQITQTSGTKQQTEFRFKFPCQKSHQQSAIEQLKDVCNDKDFIDTITNENQPDEDDSSSSSESNETTRKSTAAPTTTQKQTSTQTTKQSNQYFISSIKFSMRSDYSRVEIQKLSNRFLLIIIIFCNL